MRRWLLAVALLIAGIGAATALLDGSAFQTTHRQAVALRSDALALAPVGDAAALPPVALGISAGIDDRLDPSIAHILHAARIGVLRFGGVGADNYDWYSGCLYGDAGTQRECSGSAGNNSKLDQFLRFAAEVGAQPLIVVNGQVDDPQQAARLVAYYEQHCVRASTQPGSPCLQPYWEIGNSPATWKHFAIPLSERLPDDAQTIQPDQYAALVVSYAAAMRRAVPCGGRCLKIVADEWITGATDQSWTAAVSAIDTHYAPLLYTSSGPPPSTDDIIAAAQNGFGAAQNGFGGRPSIDSWLQGLRDSLSQFNNAGKIGIIVGQWSIDANAIQEPAIYGGYVQAVFAAELIAHLWQDAQPGGPNPLLLATQYPITGGAQEPFDIATGLPRPATGVYALLGRYFGAHPVPVQLGDAVRHAGIVAAAAVNGRRASLLLVNTDRAHAHSFRLQGLPAGPCDLWWIGPDGGGVSAIHHMQLASDNLRLSPWAIAVLQAG